MSGQEHETDTIRSVLFTSEGGGDRLAGWLHDTHALGPVVKAAAAFAGDLEGPICSQTSDALADLLSLNVVDVLLDGWSAEGALHAAARTTAANPGTTEHVTLASQTVTWTSGPSVEIRVDDVVVGRVTVTLTLQLDVTALEADVRAGHIVTFQSGACDVTASLGVNGHTLAQRRAVELTAPFRWRIESGDSLAIGAAGPGTPPSADAGEANVPGRSARTAGSIGEQRTQ